MLSPNSQNFRRYGKIIGYPNQESKGRVRNLWKIIHIESAKVGWRIAYLVLRDKTIGRLERHPQSDESFEPVRGKALIFVATKDDLSDLKCFKLDKPIIIYKNVWHGVVTLSPETEIKITENAKVTCEYLPLKRRVSSTEDFDL
jgi:ureidoglycolate hydrolase